MVGQSIQQEIERRGRIPFVDFCKLALYDPAEGYYRRSAKRVGAGFDADFQTNLAVKSVFAPIILDSVKTLVGSGESLENFRFVEVAAEPETSLLAGVEHPFGSAEVVRVGDELPALEGRVILFANEWLDAQPFVRIVFQEGRWCELGVELDGEDSLREVRMEVESTDAQGLIGELPVEAPDSYRVDVSAQVGGVLQQYLRQEWEGLFLTFDYGSSWEALSHSLPEGTGRAYFRQQLEKDLLARPGEQDLTCNVCWDHVKTALQQHGFSVGGPQRQEAFLLEKATGAIREIVEGGASAESSSQRARLMQLLNPVHFGAAFQAMWGMRGVAGARDLA